MYSFSIGRIPRIEFGSGSFAKVAEIACRYGQHVLVVTGAQSFLASPAWQQLQGDMAARDCRYSLLQVTGEPSPEWVDSAVVAWGGADVNVVIGIGGGSVLDAAKALAGLLRPGDTVMNYLEGVGPERPYRGPATPFIAVPTTAGTGSEATRNAVLTRHGVDGFKKSFRDELLVAEYAIVDPDLLADCPPPLIAGNGMDALTQLLEAYVSVRANPLTDALAWSGIRAVRKGLLCWYQGGVDVADARAHMAYAALLSGICLAQVGLGSVHGLAQPLGSLFAIPHGVVCGTLLAAATRVNIDALLMRDPGHPALAKYADVGRLLSACPALDDKAAHHTLLQQLDDWTTQLQLPALSSFGITQADVSQIVANSRGSSMKTNPVPLTDAEIEAILRLRLF
jgi:alcohol dehydrogenase class IV